MVAEIASQSQVFKSYRGGCGIASRRGIAVPTATGSRDIRWLLIISKRGRGGRSRAIRQVSGMRWYEESWAHPEVKKTCRFSPAGFSQRQTDSCSTGLRKQELSTTIRDDCRQHLWCHHCYSIKVRSTHPSPADQHSAMEADPQSREPVLHWQSPRQLLRKVKSMSLPFHADQPHHQRRLTE